MIGQYLSQTNENATVVKFKIFSHLNKVLMLYAYVARFNVTENLKNFINFFWELRSCLIRKNFQDSPSHRIFGRMHGALNIDENKN